MRIYLDTAPLIYPVENVPPYVSVIAAWQAAPGTIQDGTTDHVNKDRT
ncbi:MAG: hypothetical protein ISS56_20985 [Anaerolineae bacterium]|nr:hypothetical protein [Anaerolineae bacterium]